MYHVCDIAIMAMLDDGPVLKQVASGKGAIDICNMVV